MSKYKYRIRKNWFFIAEIEPIAFTRETDKCFYTKDKYNRGRETRHNKMSGWEEHYDSWEEAMDALLGHAQKAIENRRLGIEVARQDLVQAISFESTVRKLTKPETPGAMRVNP